MQYFIHVNGQQQGPFEESELLANGVTPSTMIWSEGMPGWQPASQVPALSYLFAGQTQQGVSQSQYGFRQAEKQRPPMPDTYLAWAILSTIFCCLPLGIVSIVKASEVSSKYNTGDYAGAEQSSRDAKKWATWSAVLALIGTALYLLVFAIGMFAGYSDY